MKSVVLCDDIREIDFKPNELFGTYIQATENDVGAYIAKPGVLKGTNCPACQTKKDTKAFSKFGLDYYECKDCGTLYVAPRPTDEAIDHYYKHSRASKYWNTTLSKGTELKRRQKIVQPRLQWVADTVREYIKDATSYIDINTRSSLVADGIGELDIFKEKMLINPLFSNTDKYKNKLKVNEKPISSFMKMETADAVSLFEVIDRTSDIATLLGCVNRILKVGGLCFITTLSISGFDLQVLRQRSNSILPPDRINVFSLEGIDLLFKKYGFECLELSTPGLLDVEIVASALKNNPSLELPSFIKYLIAKRGMGAHQAFQEFLQANRLSSYVRAVFKKCKK